MCRHGDDVDSVMRPVETFVMQSVDGEGNRINDKNTNKNGKTEPRKNEETEKNFSFHRSFVISMVKLAVCFTGNDVR
jgi:hypothetical protein